MKTKEELYSENFDVLSVNGKEVLFTCLRISREIIPEGLHAYDIRESDTGGEFATIEPRVIVNHAGTILSKEVIEMGPDGFVEIDEYGFEDSMTLQEWLVLTPSKSKCRKCKSDIANRYAIFRAYTTKNLKPKTGKYHD